MSVLEVRVRYTCSSCRAMHDRVRMFDLGEEVVCEGCFGMRYFPALEKLGYEIKKIRDVRVNRRKD